jgi:uncharacterized protein YgbK (DUF1537 family)
MSEQPVRPVLGCIADDFTGATDLANNLVRSGLRTVQTIGVPADGAPAPQADALVVALKSRTIAPAEAVAQSLAALQWLLAQGVAQVYFKYCSTFDSTAQGNIGPVTDALLAALADRPGSGITIACPAFPENGRTVYQGHLFVGDTLLSDSGMRHHPLTPMTDANLLRVLQPQTRHPVGLVAHDVVARGADAVRARLQALQAEGVRIAVVDAVGPADLMAIGAALKGMALVTAGSGVAVGLAQNWPALAARAGSAQAAQLPPAGGARAVVSGSCSVATNAQVLRARQAGVPAFAIDPLALAVGADGTDVVAQALAWATARLAEGACPLVYATAEPAAVQAVQARLGVAQAGALVEHALARIAHGLVGAGVRQLVVAGGETSGAVVQALGVTQMAIGPQIDPGVPWTAVHSPAAGGQVLHLALKSGNFGSPDFFTQAFSRLVEAA